MPIQTFEATLERSDNVGSSTWLPVPFSVEQVFGAKAQVKVRGTIDGVPYRGSVMPQGDGTHSMVVKKEIRDAIGKHKGDTVHVEMELDDAPRVVDVPDDLQAALAEHDAACAFFEKLTYSHQKIYVDWINDAKADATRQRRIQGAIERLTEGKVLK